jgi:hypothetical protein
VGLGECDVFFNLELHGVDDEICTVRSADGIVVGEHMACKLFSEGVGDVTGDETTDGGGDSKWSEFGFVEGVFVEAKKVDVREVSCDGGWEVILIDLVEDEVEVCGDVWEFGLDEVDEDVDGVGINTGAFVAAGVEDSGAYVAG